MPTCSSEKNGLPVNKFIAECVGDCLYDGTDYASFSLGILSIIIWAIVLFPRIIDNYRTSAADSQSIWLWVLWLSGDCFNVFGCLYGNQLPTQVGLALLYFLMTTILLFQFLYYNYLKKTTSLSMESNDLTPLLTPRLQRMTSLTSSPGMAFIKLHREDRATVNGLRSKLSRPNTYDATTSRSTPHRRYSDGYFDSPNEEPEQDRKREREREREREQEQEQDLELEPEPETDLEQNFNHQEGEKGKENVNSSRGGGQTLLPLGKKQNGAHSHTSSSPSKGKSGNYMKTSQSGKLRIVTPPSSSTKSTISSNSQHSPSPKMERHRRHSSGGGTPPNWGVLSCFFFGFILMGWSYNTNWDDHVMMNWVSSYLEQSDWFINLETNRNLNNNIHLGTGRVLLTRPLESTRKQFITAWVLGWLMTIVYMSSRVPQIVTILQESDAGSLSASMFVLTFGGNLTYTISVLLRSSNSYYLMEHLPWLVDSFGTVLQDFLILCLYTYYRYRKPKPHPRRRGLGGLHQIVTNASSDSSDTYQASFSPIILGSSPENEEEGQS